MLEEQARHLLTEAERQTMGYYMDQYRDGHIGVEQLVVALFELLNTHAKVKTEEVFLKANDQTSRFSLCKAELLLRLWGNAACFDLRFYELISSFNSGFYFIIYPHVPLLMSFPALQ